MLAGSGTHAIRSAHRDRVVLNNRTIQRRRYRDPKPKHVFNELAVLGLYRLDKVRIKFSDGNASALKKPFPLSSNVWIRVKHSDNHPLNLLRHESLCARHSLASCARL